MYFSTDVETGARLSLIPRAGVPLAENSAQFIQRRVLIFNNILFSPLIIAAREIKSR